MSLKAELGRAVRIHRERMGMTQLELGEAVGRSLQAIGAIERGQSLPALETLEAIARALQTPLRAFFPPAEPPEDEATARILARLAALQPAERAWVDAVLTAMLRRP